MTSKVELPRINRGNSSVIEPLTISPDKKLNSDQNWKQGYISPFKLPSDDEVFVFREIERKKKDELKQISHQLKVWDKKTATSKKALRLFKDFEAPIREGAQGNYYGTYSSKEKAMISEAQKIIYERRKYRDIGGRDQKEGIFQLLDQKKEMFLVEMTVGIIEKEKDMLVQKANEKEEALKKSDEMLHKDEMEFETYKQTNKLETDKAMQKYNQEVEQRKRTETEYKIKNNDLTNIKAEKAKQEELIQKYLEAKNFLERVTPKEILEQRQKELNQKIEEVRSQWMEREQSIRDGICLSQNPVTDLETQSNISESNIKVVSNRDKKSPGKKTQKFDVEKAFMEKVEKGDFDEIEDFKHNQKVYFDDPEQLIEVFTRLEEGNLALIQMMQDTEQNLENLKNSLKQKKNEFDKKISGLREHKMQLEKNKVDKLREIKMLEKKAKEPNLAKTDDELAPLRKKVIEVVHNIMKDEVKSPIDYENMETLELLTVVEVRLQKHLQKLNEFRPTRMLELKKLCEEKRKVENRRLQAERDSKLAEERRAKANERAQEKSKKRKGRLDMMKSTPFEKKETNIQVVETNEEEEDIKYFKPYMTKF